MTPDSLRRAVRRGLANVAIQVYLTAAVMNLKRLAGAFLQFFAGYKYKSGYLDFLGVLKLAFIEKLLFNQVELTGQKTVG